MKFVQVGDHVFVVPEKVTCVIWYDESDHPTVYSGTSYGGVYADHFKSETAKGRKEVLQQLLMRLNSVPETRSKA